MLRSFKRRLRGLLDRALLPYFETQAARPGEPPAAPLRVDKGVQVLLGILTKLDLIEYLAARLR